MQQSLKKNLGTFRGKDGKEYIAGFAGLEHSDSIVDLFIEAYGFDYLYPYVYHTDEIKKEMMKPGHYWCMVALKDSNEVAGVSVVKKINENSLYVGKVNLKKKYRGLGLGRGLAANAFTTFIGSQEFSLIRRLDSDVRVNNLNSQIFIEKVGSKPYGFIPNYNNYGDKRNYNPKCGKPFTSGLIESVILYASVFNSFWKMRKNEIVLYNDDDIIYFYDFVRSINRKMKRDEISIGNNGESDQDIYRISEDFYKGCVKLEGYIDENTLKYVLNKYNEWNVIEWRIPANLNGIDSQKLGLKHGFIVVGYDPGSLYFEELEDSVVMCKFPNGVDLTQFKKMNLTKHNKIIADKVISSLK